MKILITDCEDCKSFEDEECSNEFSDFNSCKYNVYYDTENHRYIYELKEDADNE